MAATTPALTFAALMLPFLAALLAPMLSRLMGHLAALVLALAPALACLHFLSFLPEIAAGESATGGYVWVPSFNLSFSWFLDGLSLTFALLITGIGTLIVLYSGAYMKGHPDMKPGELAEYQQKISNANRVMDMVTNILKQKHETAMAIIMNMK